MKSENLPPPLENLGPKATKIFPFFTYFLGKKTPVFDDENTKFRAKNPILGLKILKKFD